MPPEVAPAAAAVIVAAGRGSRFGRSDKVLVELAGRPLLAFALDAAQAAASISCIVVVAGEHTLEATRRLIERGEWPKAVAPVPGGERRQDSVLAGLAAVPANYAFVAVHDGARPFAAPSLYNETIGAAIARGAAIAAVPITDTLKRATGNRVIATVPRDELWAAQTPQSAATATLRTAIQRASSQGLTFTDEASALEAAGVAVHLVPGSPTNLKVTRPEDLAVAGALLAAGLIDWLHT